MTTLQWDVSSLTLQNARGLFFLFVLYLQFLHPGSSLKITRLNYISIPATVALVTAAMATS